VRGLKARGELPNIKKVVPVLERGEKLGVTGLGKRDGGVAISRFKEKGKKKDKNSGGARRVLVKQEIEHRRGGFGPMADKAKREEE